MTSLRDVRNQFQKRIGKLQPIRPTRTAVIGDGNGNVAVPNTTDYVWARDTVESSIFYPVLNHAAVGYEVNLPVVIGFTDALPNQEQIIGINWGGLGPGQNPTTIAPIGIHHRQHEFRGGDDVSLDSRQIKPGRVKPTDPPSMSVIVESFIFQWEGRWYSFEEETTPLLTEYQPEGGILSVLLITLDPEEQELRYRPGPPYNPAFYPDSIVNHMLASPGYELPLGYVFLQGGMTSIDWTQIQDHIGDARPNSTPSLQIVYDRLEQLEGLSGNNPNIALTGAGEQTDDIDRTLNGLTDVDTTGVIDAQALVFQLSTNRWVPGTAGAHAILSATHTDSASAVTPIDGDILTFRGVEWTAESGVNIGSDAADITAINFTQSSSDITAPGAGHRLIYTKGAGLFTRDAGGTVVGPLAMLTTVGPSDISGASVLGVATSAALGDHVHRGVQSVNVPGNALLFGKAYIESGTGTTVAQSGNSILISASGGGGAGVSSIMVAGASPLQSNVFLLPGTGASLSQSGASITIGLSPGAWTSAVQTPNRAVETVYTNSSVTRMVSISMGLSPGSATAQATVFAGPTSAPSTEIARLNPQTPVGVAVSAVMHVGFMVLPNEYYWIRQISGSVNIIDWIEYGDLGGGGGGGGGVGVSSINVAGASPLQGNIFLIPGTGASLSQSGASITIDLVSGNGWTSAIQTPGRGMEIVYTNGSLARMVSITTGLNPTTLVTAQVSLQTGAGSPPSTEIARQTAVSGLPASVVGEVIGMVMPNERYWLRNQSGVASADIVRWIEYDDTGAPVINTARVFGGRLTYDGNNVVTTANVAAASVLYYLPYNGDQVSLYTTASVWNTVSFVAPSLVLTGLSPNSAYDIFGYKNINELTLETARWNPNNITRVTGLSMQNGTWAAATNRTRVLLGTLYIGGTSAQSEDSTTKRFLWNTFNRLNRKLSRKEDNVGWSYNLDVWRQAFASSANQVEVVIGLADNPVQIEVGAYGDNNSVVGFGAVGIGITGTSTNAADFWYETGFNGATLTRGLMQSKLYHQAAGFYQYTWLEKTRSGSMNYRSTLGTGTAAMQSGIFGITVA